MGGFKVGDLVARKSYGLDIIFKVTDIRNNGVEDVLTLKGVCYRIQADAPESDLMPQPQERASEHTVRMLQAAERKSRSLAEAVGIGSGIGGIRNIGGIGSADSVNSAGGRSGRSKGSSESSGSSASGKAGGISGAGGMGGIGGIGGRYLALKKIRAKNTANDPGLRFKVPGKVLHLDGDGDYMQSCLDQYRKLGIEAIGRHVPERDQPSMVARLIYDTQPDILVLTGHDGVAKGEKKYQELDSYKNSRYYINAVKEARKAYRDLDELVIFAGACQSMYEGLISAGANYASAPGRVLIHALDPVFICHKVAFTGIDRVLDPLDVISSTITGKDGIGGIQTRGKYREGYPKEPFGN